MRAGEEVGDGNFLLFGQESNGQTRSLARLNMLLHKQDGARIDWCDTLNSPTLIESDHLMRFDVVVANPPFSLDKWWDATRASIPTSASRRICRRRAGATMRSFSTCWPSRVPRSGAWPWVAPHGVLFRSGAEGRIREKLIRDNLLDAVIGLPAQLFPTTGIPVCIMVLDRAREPGGLRSHERDILFIDASRDFEPGKKQNRLRDEDVAKIIDTYRGRIERERYAKRATFEEIEENGFNLNIPRYVDTFEPEPEVDLQAVQNEIRDLEGKLAETRARMNVYLKELGIDV